MSTHIRSNKPVIGDGNVTLSGGGLYLYEASNVIIRNLTITGSTEDNIGIHYSDHVWIDHCTLTDSTDGKIDITQASDYITISWCKFMYRVDNGHDYVNLIASSDSDTHGIGWCAPQQGACKLSLNIKEGIIQEALVETIGCSGMTHSAAIAAEIIIGKTILDALAKAKRTYGRFAEAAKYVDPRHE